MESTIQLRLTDPPTVLSVSGSIVELLEFDREAFLTARIRLEDRIHPGDADIARQLFAPGPEEASRVVNIRLRSAAGTIRCVRCTYSKECAPGGQWILSLLLQDARHLWRNVASAPITPNFAVLMESTDDFIFFKDRNHVFTGASQNIFRALDLVRHGSSVLGLTDYDLFPEEYADKYYQLEKQVFASGSMAREVQEGITPDGKKQWIDNRKYPIRNEAGEIVGLFGVVRDITDNMDVIGKLRESEQLLREAQKIAGLGSYLLDISAGSWTSSEVLDELLGISKEFERTVASWISLVHPEDRDRMQAYFTSEVLGKRTDFDKEYRIVRRSDGAVRWVHGKGRLAFDGEGQPIRMRGIIRDITERRLAEEALRESVESLREAEKIAGIGSYVLDVQSGIWKTSEALDAMMGIDDSYDHTRHAWLPLIHPEDREAVHAHYMNDVLGQGKPFEKEYRILRHTDKEVRWVRGRGRVDLDAQGRPVLLRGTIQDITERKKADAALRQSKNLLELFIQHAPAQLAMFDKEMRYLAASRRWLENYGLAGQQVIGRSRYDLPPAVSDTWREAHRRTLAGEVVRGENDLYLTADGQRRWLRWENIPWRTDEGEIGGIIIFAEDVTERLQAERESRESRDLLELFIQNAPVALAMFDREMHYLAVSERWARDHALTDKAILGRSHYEVNPDVPERWKETHRRGLAGERQRVEEDCLEHADGRIQWIRWEILPWRTGDGAIGGIIMFYEDITERRQAEAALRESKNLFELFIRHAPAALAMFDREMRYLAVSRRWIEIYSLEGREIIGHSHYEIVPGLPERWKEAHRRGLAGETLRAEEDCFVHPDGALQWIRWEVIPWRTAAGAVGGIILFAEDISQSKQIEEQLRLAARVFAHAREGIFVTNPDGIILEINDAFTRITGYPREEVIGQNPRMLQSGLQSKEFYQSMWRSLRDNGQWSGEIWDRARNGDIFAAMLSITAVRDKSGVVLQYVALFSDITELKERERQLQQVAHYDVVTSLPNRTLLADRLRQAMAQAHRRKQLLAVAYLDLDHFKQVNDTYGHAVGDQLLSTLANRMKRALREGDTLARLGGDEFVAVLLDLNTTKASTPVISRLLEAASQEVCVGELVLRVSASIGVVFYPQQEDVDADQLLRQADQAMYQAKLAGSNCSHVFDPRQDLTIRGRHEILEQIRRALAANEFVLYYQPKVNMRTGAVVGAEALIRWRHPERGLLPPGMFLPAVEDQPVSIELGEWVMNSALQQMDIWQAAGLHVPVSVNVDAYELQQPDFIERLRSLLAAHPAIQPSSLQIEILETSALQDVVLASRVLEACHEMGISIAIDDFGAGYSSLTYLKRLPAHILKIDQSFVSNMLDDTEDLAILEGVLGLASAFRREVIAEGVETVDHGLLLLQMGCELAQGYGIARPMPAGELSGWVETWRPDPRWTHMRPVAAGNRPLLFACVEHRAWLAACEAFLHGRRNLPVHLNLAGCRFAAWLESEKRAGRDNLPSYHTLQTLHRQFHELTIEICGLHANGEAAQAIDRLDRLYALRDQLFEQVTRLP